MKKHALRRAVLAGGAIALLLFVGVASAAVTFDSETGKGFVGKGDVQLALGLNNAQLQAQATTLRFTYVDQVEYEVPCIKETKKDTMRRTFDRKRSLNNEVQYETRQNKQVTGFKLTGWKTTEVEGNVSCPGGWDADGEPFLVEGSATEGVLRVNAVELLY